MASESPLPLRRLAPPAEPMKKTIFHLGAALLFSFPAFAVFAADPAITRTPIRGEVIINRTNPTFATGEGF